MRVADQCLTPTALPPGKETLYPLYRRLGGPQSRSGRVQKISSPPVFDLRILQPVAHRWTVTAWSRPVDPAKDFRSGNAERHLSHLYHIFRTLSEGSLKYYNIHTRWKACQSVKLRYFICVIQVKIRGTFSLGPRCSSMSWCTIASKI